MADRRATNKYYPPEWDPSKGSLNQYHGQHPLRERARKLDQGILIVRFELPFNIWCGGCDKHIGRGVRYNAEKKKIGNYYSTPILSFRMKCHLCSHWFEIHTDPQNARYVVVEGARQKVETWEPDDSEVIRISEETDRKRRAENAFAQVEHTVEDKRRANAQAQRIDDLQSLNEQYWHAPDDQSRLLRNRFRVEKRQRQQQKKEADAIRAKHSLSIPIVPESVQDVVAARAVTFGDPHYAEQAVDRQRAVATAPLFQSTPARNNPNHPIRQRIVSNTRRKLDPFLAAAAGEHAPGDKARSLPDVAIGARAGRDPPPPPPDEPASLVCVGYGSDSE